MVCLLFRTSLDRSKRAAMLCRQNGIHQSWTSGPDKFFLTPNFWCHFLVAFSLHYIFFLLKSLFQLIVQCSSFSYWQNLKMCSWYHSLVVYGVHNAIFAFKRWTVESRKSTVLKIGKGPKAISCWELEHSSFLEKNCFFPQILADFCSMNGGMNKNLHCT